MTTLIQRRSALATKNNDTDATDVVVGPRAPTKSGVKFMDLPAEIHILVSKELIYPDALSLKHTSRYFYDWVDTGVKLKVDWLMERRELHLDCPNDRKCNLRTDLDFCRGSVTSVTAHPLPHGARCGHCGKFRVDQKC